MVFHKPACTETPSGLFICRTEENNIAFQLYSSPFEEGQSHELSGSNSLTVDRAATVYVTVLDRTSERLNLPICYYRWDDIKVMQQDKRFLLPSAFQAGIDYPTFRL